MPRRLRYAFGPVRRGKKAPSLKYFIMPYAFKLNDDGTPDAEAKVRLDDAAAIVNQRNGVIFLGAGMENYAKTKGANSLSESAHRYLITKGLSEHRIAIRVEGFNTVTETRAFRTFLSLHASDNHVCEVVTSWWHVPRVWLVCRIIFGKAIKVHGTSSAHFGFQLVYDIAREMVVLPYSVCMAVNSVYNDKKQKHPMNLTTQE